MGLDGIAMCAAEEDFTLVDELGIEIVQDRQPWYDQIRGNELQQLFGEKQKHQFKHKRRH
jgi:hypothetical protein